MAITKKQIAVMTNKILCLHQWWDGTGAISLLLSAIDSIRQRRLQHLYSTKEKKRGEGAVIEVRRISEKRSREGMGRARQGNKRTKLNTERRDWKVFLQTERRRAR